MSSGRVVTVTSSSDEKLERARAHALGADVLISDRRTPEWNAEARRLSGGCGADLVLETVGRADLRPLGRCGRVRGVVFVIGSLTGARPTIDVLPVMEKKLRVLGNNTGLVAALAAAAGRPERSGPRPASRRGGVDAPRNWRRCWSGVIRATSSRPCEQVPDLSDVVAVNPTRWFLQSGHVAVTETALAMMRMMPASRVTPSMARPDGAQSEGNVGRRR